MACDLKLVFDVHLLQSHHYTTQFNFYIRYKGDNFYFKITSHFLTFISLKISDIIEQANNNMKTKKYHTVVTGPKSNPSIVERCNIKTPNIHI